MRQPRAGRIRRRSRNGPAQAVQARIGMIESVIKQEQEAFQSLVKQKQAFYEDLLLEFDKLLAEEERLLTEGRGP